NAAKLTEEAFQDCIEPWTGDRLVAPVELVTVTANGVEVLRSLGVALDLAPQPADINGEEVAGELGIVAPDGLEELVAMERAAAVAGEGVEEFELPLREGQSSAVDARHPASGIDLEAADLDGRALGRVGIVVRAAKLRPHAGQQLPRIE